MKKDEIIEIAMNSGLPSKEAAQHQLWWLEAFAKLVAAKEREEIAQFIDSTELAALPDALKQHYARMLSFYSSQIRARGEA